MHRKQWHVTILTEEGLKLFSNRIPGNGASLMEVLDRYDQAKQITAVYEAGYFGFWLYDFLMEMGIEVRITPPSLIPSQAGNLVKTDRKDSVKLAEYVRKDLLKSIYVPTKEERSHRQVARRRRQFIQDRVRIQNRIKAELRFTGLELPEESTGKWSLSFVDKLRGVRFQDEYQQASFTNLLDQLDYTSKLVDRQSQMLKQLSQNETYQDRVEILCSIPGIGWLSAIEILLELQDVARFQKADGLAAYVGLTPSQHSTGDAIRLGHITRQGKPSVRSLLIQASWRLIQKDPAMKDKYERLKARSGGKRAIVAIARTLIIRLRRMLLDQQPYQIASLAA